MQATKREINPAGSATGESVHYPTEACATCEAGNLWCQRVRDDSLSCKVPDWSGIRRKPILRGEYLFRAGEPFRAIYVLCNGSLKGVLSDHEREFITGFHIAGEPVGLDAIHSGQHHCSAVALEDGHVCEVPFDQLERSCLDEPISQRWLHRSMSREILRRYERVSALARTSMEGRMAAFLLNLSMRFSATRIPLCMSRDEMGSYLGMTAEAISCTLRKFHASRLITARPNQIELVDINGLRLAADGCAK